MSCARAIGHVSAAAAAADRSSLEKHCARSRDNNIRLSGPYGNRFVIESVTVSLVQSSNVDGFDDFLIFRVSRPVDRHAQYILCDLKTRTDSTIHPVDKTR